MIEWAVGRGIHLFHARLEKSDKKRNCGNKSWHGLDFSHPTVSFRLVVTSELRGGGGLPLGRGDPIRAGYAGVEVMGGCNWVRRKGAGCGKKNHNRAAGARFWQTQYGGASCQVEGPYLGGG
jgi:hypothetical protein